MKDTIKVIIADDNIHLSIQMKNFLKDYSDIEILGIATTDSEEIKLIEELKPDIVITDLVRNYKYTGLDIIRSYYKKENAPQFLVVSAEEKKNAITDGLEVAGYLKKPFEYKNIVNELRRIKKISKGNKLLDYEEWYKIYNEYPLIDPKVYLDSKCLDILNKLKIEIKDKVYTHQEYEILRQNLLQYYEDENTIEEQREYIIPLENVNVSKDDYKYLMDKFEIMEEKICLLVDY